MAVERTYTSDAFHAGDRKPLSTYRLRRRVPSAKWAAAPAAVRPPAPTPQLPSGRTSLGKV